MKFLFCFLLFAIAPGIQATRALHPGMHANGPAQQLYTPGYYISEQALIHKGFQFNWLEATLNEQGRPVFYLSLTDTKKKAGRNILNSQYRLDPGMIILHFDHRAIGQITVEGQFLESEDPATYSGFRGTLVINGKSQALNLHWRREKSGI